MKLTGNRIGTLIGIVFGLGFCLVFFWPLFTDIRDANEYARVESTRIAREIATSEAQATLVPLNVDFGYDKFKEIGLKGKIYIVGKDELPENVSAKPSTGSMDTQEGAAPYKVLEFTAFGSNISVTQWHTQCDVGIPGILSIGYQDKDGNCSVTVRGPGWQIAVHFNGTDWEIAVPIH